MTIRELTEHEKRHMQGLIYKEVYEPFAPCDPLSVELGGLVLDKLGITPGDGKDRLEKFHSLMLKWQEQAKQGLQPTF